MRILAAATKKTPGIVFCLPSTEILVLNILVCNFLKYSFGTQHMWSLRSLYSFNDQTN